MPHIKIKLDSEPYGYQFPNEDFVEVPMPNGESNDTERILAIANVVLAQQRLNALDHEHEGEVWHGACLLRTKQGKYFLHANIHVTDNPTSRACAEANAITDARSVEGSNLEVEKMWFMGGLTDISKHIAVVPKHAGKRFSPCGSCLGVIFKFRLKVDGETEVNILPLNEGTWHLIPFRGEPYNLEANEVLTLTINQLFPSVSKFLPDKDGSLKQDLKNAWEFITDPSTVKMIDQATRTKELVQLRKINSPEKIEKKINEIMVDTLHQLCGGHPELEFAKVMIVRTEEGTYHLATSVKSKSAPGSAKPIHAAMNDAQSYNPNSRITDVFTMTVNFKRIKELREIAGENEAADIEVAMPGGDTRDRIRKMRPDKAGAKGYRGDDIDTEIGPTVHVFLPNNKKDFDPDRHIVRMTSKELLPFAYVNPKSEVARGL